MPVSAVFSYLISNSLKFGSVDRVAVPRGSLPVAAVYEVVGVAAALPVAPLAALAASAIVATAAESAHRRRVHQLQSNKILHQLSFDLKLNQTY